MNTKAITRKEFSNFKQQFPDNEQIQNTSFEALRANTYGTALFDQWVRLNSVPEAAGVKEEDAWVCGTAVGFVIYDCIALFLGAPTTRSGASETEANLIAKAAESVQPQILETASTFSNFDASPTDQATAVFEIVKTMYDGGCLGSVLLAFFSSLSWYNMLLYSASAMAAIITALATDGAAEIAAIEIELAIFSSIITDSIACDRACG